MTTDIWRAYIVELIGTFGLVYVSAGAVCVNCLAVPANQPYGTTPLTLHQPGLAGSALAQGLIYAVLLAVTVPVSGAYLNPAITVTLWLSRRLDALRACWLIGAQLVGAFLAGTALRFTFAPDVLKFATPHVNLLAFNELTPATLLAGTGIELVLTFFLVLAIFGSAGEKSAAWAGGAVLAAAVLVSLPLTGTALNPARWFGTVLWEIWLAHTGLGRQGPFDDALVYLAGPTLGALLAGAFCFLVLAPGRREAP